jgi:hypothetical protein
VTNKTGNLSCDIFLFSLAPHTSTRAYVVSERFWELRAESPLHDAIARLRQTFG